jgi:hypothetical protein
VQTFGIDLRPSSRCRLIMAKIIIGVARIKAPQYLEPLDLVPIFGDDVGKLAARHVGRNLLVGEFFHDDIAFRTDPAG